MRQFANRRQRGGRRMGPALVTLGSSVVLAVYGAGWLETRAFRAELHPPAQEAPFGNDFSTEDGRVARGPLPSSDHSDAPPASPALTLAPTATPEASYREGRYVGRGESVHGGVTVAIVISGSRIASAEIVKCDTRYACTEIDSLSEQVVERQSARLRYVSGATDSSRAYVKAIEAALAKASV
jgi:uncharacterized protein with FMN-binding domain